MSYRKKHVKAKLNRIKPRKSIFKRLWFWILILIVLVVSTVTYCILFYQGLQLETIVISGNTKVKTQDLQDIVAKYSRTDLINFWNIKITSGSIFLVDAGSLRRDILKGFPEIESLLINKKLPQTLNLSVVERKSLGVFCDSGNKCFFIDENGTVFEPLVDVPLDIVIVRQSIESITAVAGQRVLPQNIMSVIFKVQRNLKDSFNLDLKEATVVSSSRLNIKMAEGWKVYFDLGSELDINTQIEKLDLLLSGDLSAGKDGVTRNNLRYVDLRPKDRAIVCNNSTCGGN